MVDETKIAFPDDIIVAILSYLPKDFRFKMDRKIIHNTFFQFKKKYPKIFNGFTFDRDGLFATSTVIDQAFNNLEMSKHLRMFNIDEHIYIVNSSLKDYYIRSIKENILEYEEDIKKMAKEIKKKWKSAI